MFETSRGSEAEILKSDTIIHHTGVHVFLLKWPYLWNHFYALTITAPWFLKQLNGIFVSSCRGRAGAPATILTHGLPAEPGRIRPGATEEPVAEEA